MKALSNLVNSALGLSPYRLIHHANLTRLKLSSGYKANPDVLAEHLRQVFRKAAIRCVFDVGGNDGAYAQFLRKEVGFDGLIVTFEPLTQKLKVINKLAAEDPQWIIQPCALGAQEGRATINIMNSDAFSSFLQPDHSHVAKYGDSNLVTGTEEVQVRTLASVYSELAPQHGISRFYLKIDTQGFDLEVFRGALPVIHQVPAMQTELSFVPLYHGAPSWQEALALFRTEGYEPSTFAPVCFDETMRIIEADCVLTHPQRMAAL